MTLESHLDPNRKLLVEYNDLYIRARKAVIVGTGLGLYFVKTVVELHGGEVTVQSREGAGSCFQVRLPLRLAVPGTATPPGVPAIA